MNERENESTAPGPEAALWGGRAVVAVAMVLLTALFGLAALALGAVLMLGTFMIAIGMETRE